MLKSDNNYTINDCDYKLSFIDAGMVTSISKKDHKNLLLLMKSVVS